MNQQPLFQVERTTPQECPVPGCQTIRLAGQTGQLITCAHDLEREHGRARPRGCLNEIDNAFQEIPY